LASNSFKKLIRGVEAMAFASSVHTRNVRNAIPVTCASNNLEGGGRGEVQGGKGERGEGMEEERGGGGKGGVTGVFLGGV